MSTTLSSHGTPTGSVFGKLGETIGTDEGRAYYKLEYDTLNIGWGSPITPAPTPTPEPTPTPIPYEANAFACTELEATGSIKANNELKLQFNTSAVTNLSFFATWSRATSLNDPVNISGYPAVTSLVDGETSYSSAKLNVFPNTFNFGISRPSSSLDTASIHVNTFGAGPMRSARLFGYSSGSSPIVLRANGITGNYVYHSRNSSGNLVGGTGGYISSVISSSAQLMVTASINSPVSTHLLEIVSYNGILTFVPIEIKERVRATPQHPSHSIWLNYDNLGKANASWRDPAGNLQNRSLVGTPYSKCASFNGLCVITGSLSVTSGTNYREAVLCGASDPRTVSYQIDVTTNLNGEYNFNYLDPYGVSRNANGIGLPSTKIYGIVCGYSITSTTRGAAEISTRLC